MISDGAFPVEPWHVRETRLDLDLLAQSESVFALSNGHIGLRGNLDEGEPFGLPGTYLGSFFETRPLPYAEAGFGYPEDGQTLVDVTNGKIMRLIVDDEPFDVRYGELLDHERVLDLRAGTLTRRTTWRSPAGQAVKVRSTRLVSFAQRGVAAIEYIVEAVDEFVRVSVQSELVANEDQPRMSADPRVSAALSRPARGGPARDRRARCPSGAPHPSEWPDDGGRHGARDRRPRTRRGRDRRRRRTGPAPPSSCGLRPGQRLRIVKYLAYGWSSLRSRPALRDQVSGRADRRPVQRLEGLLDAQREYLDDFWDSADVEVEGDPDIQQAVRFGLFHVLQASARAERRAIAGKGLTGTGYDGHAFWDTEGFVLPVLTYTVRRRPPPTRCAGGRRRSTWPRSAPPSSTSRARASRGARSGVRSARRTGRPAPRRGTSTPTSPMAFERYRTVTGDESLEEECGLEVLVETARLWMSLGHHDRHGVWHIDGVTGPDEYTAVVRDNVFTNLMAAQQPAHAPPTRARGTPRRPAAWA